MWRELPASRLRVRCLRASAAWRKSRAKGKGAVIIIIAIIIIISSSSSGGGSGGGGSSSICVVFVLLWLPLSICERPAGPGGAARCKWGRTDGWPPAQLR